MTQHELKAVVTVLVNTRILKESNTQECVEAILFNINQHVSEVIGKDDAIGFKGSNFEIRNMDRNALRGEQRERAGIKP